MSIEEQDKMWGEALSGHVPPETLEQKFRRAINGLEKLAELGKELKGKDIILGYAGVVVNHEKLEYYMHLSEDGRRTTIMPLGEELPQNSSAFHDYSFKRKGYCVDVDDLLLKFLTLGGENSRVRVDLDLGSFSGSPRKDDIRKYLDTNPIKSERVRSVTADLFTSPEPIMVQFWKDYPGSEEDKKYNFRVQCAKPYELEIMKLMEGRGMKFMPNEYNLEYETEENPWTLSEFIAMTEDIGRLAGTSRYIVTSLEMDVPIRNLKITNTPPQLSLEYRANGLHTTYGYGSLRPGITVTVPIQDVSKAVNIFGAVKPK